MGSGGVNCVHVGKRLKELCGKKKRKKRRKLRPRKRKEEEDTTLGVAERLLTRLSGCLGFLIGSTDTIRTGGGPRDFGGVDASTLEEVRAVCCCGLPGSDGVMGNWICWNI